MNMPQTKSVISPAKLGLAWAVVAVVLLGDFLDLLDSMVTTIAGPSIVRDLGGGDEFIQWLAAGYTLAMAAGLLIGARLGDMFGRKRMFLIGITGFTLTSLLAALAMSPEMLVTMRIAQGLVGAMMVPQALGLIKQSFPPHKVGLAFGLTGPVLALGGVAGPIVSGWLVDANYFGWGWRIIFAVNVPVGVALIIAGAIILPNSNPDRSIRLDVGGAVLAALGMGAVVFGLVHGRDYDWAWWVIAIIVAGFAGLVGFALTQRARGHAGKSTLVTPSLFSKRAFLAGLGVGACFFGAMIGSSLMFALFFQLGMGLSPLQAGLAAAPQAIGMIVGFVLSQVLGLTRRTMFVGFGTVTVGFIAVIVLTTAIAGDLTVWPLLIPLGIVGIGMGLAIAPFFDIVLAGVHDTEVGSASGSLTAVQQLGNAVGVSALGTIFFTALSDAAADDAAYTHALSATLGWAIGLVVLAAAITSLLPRRARENTELIDRADERMKG